MGFGAYDEDEDQKDQDVNLEETGEGSRIDYQGDVEFTGSTEDIWNTYQKEVKNNEDKVDAEEEFGIDDSELDQG